jgi:ribonuclease BN (tRNA processing enzyme)
MQQGDFMSGHGGDWVEEGRSGTVPRPVTRRMILERVLSVAALAGVPVVGPGTARAQDTGGGITLSPPAQGPRPGTWLVILGTHGGPGIDPAHAQTASALVVDGRPYLIDCGYGALRALVAANVAYREISTLFFTHLHDDHTGDLAALLSFQWTNGKSSATDAYGPYGTARLVDAAVSLIRVNAEIRTVDEGRSVEPGKLFHGHDTPAAAEAVSVFKDDRLSVTAVENAHFPPRSTARMPHRSLALRLETKTRSVVCCGDTAYSPNIVRLARGADLLLCEVADAGILEQMRERAKAAEAAGNAESIFRHVAETHSSATDVGRMAAEAGVKTVVLNHLVPGPQATIAYPVTSFIDGVRQRFTGEVIVGQDLMVL